MCASTFSYFSLSRPGGTGGAYMCCTLMTSNADKPVVVVAAVVAAVVVEVVVAAAVVVVVAVVKLVVVVAAAATEHNYFCVYSRYSVAHRYELYKEMMSKGGVAMSKGKLYFDKNFV
ncbi:hypothetical protein ElyMa_000094600 [Elysia marginata]|uniref:Uncharacterized protein n=1 Tax=Elysia marginata TaxID=1093978 RepID=A0AAV4ELB7_9GAST|nr:hypothetical protein ElyMa_000094600 [Elysia marginata]